MLAGTSSPCARLIASLVAAGSLACAIPGSAVQVSGVEGPELVDRNGFYVGGALGWSDGTADDSEFEDDLAPTHVTSVDLDDQGFAWKVWGLYRFLQYFGVELGFTHLRVPDSTVRELRGPNGSLAADVDDVHPLGGYGGTLSLKAFTPEWKRLSAYGQLGLWYWAARIDVTVTPSAGPSSSAEVREEGIDFFGGAGVQYDAGAGFLFQLGWERYFLDGDGVDFFSAGVNYGF